MRILRDATKKIGMLLLVLVIVAMSDIRNAPIARREECLIAPLFDNIEEEPMKK
jgi:hypothetical protein